MKTKLLITLTIITLGVTFFSFKYSGEGQGSHIALVMAVEGKDDNEGYLIMYGDGTTELFPFHIGKFTSSQNALECTAMTSKLMNKLFDKGYHFVGNSNSANSKGAYLYPYMIFEKK